MKKLLSFILLLFISIINAQDVEAPTITYVSFSPCITNEPGNFGTKFSPTIEVGREFEDVFTLGIAVGKTNLNRQITSANDNNNYPTVIGTTSKFTDDVYVEVRPNLNVFQVGKFVNTFTTGVGYVFGPTKSLMLEFTSGVEYSYTDTIHLNIFYGNYYYSPFSSAPDAPTHFNPTFVGFSVVKFFKPSKSKGLVKVQ